MRQVVMRGRQRVLAVDPGGTTGWVLFEPSAEVEDWGGYGINVIDWGEERDQDEVGNLVWRWKTARLKHERLTAVVCERFVPRPGVRTWEPEPIEIAGNLRWLIGKERFFLQQPSDAKAFGTATKIHKYIRGWDLPFNVGRGGAGHAHDALRHALLFTNVRWSPEEAAA